MARAAWGSSVIALDATTQSIEIATSSIADLDWIVSWVDSTTTAFTPGSAHGTVAAITTTTIVAAPAASTQRGVKHVSLRNRHASTSQTVTVKKDVSTTEYEIAKATLAAGESLVYEDGAGWQVYNSSGMLATAQSTGSPSGAAGGSLAGTYPNPTIAALAITDAEVATANKDGVAGTASMRTLGTGATTAAAGNDARLSDARTPTAHKTSHEPGGGDALTVGAAAATGSLRTIGTGALEACAGNDRAPKRCENAYRSRQLSQCRWRGCSRNRRRSRHRISSHDRDRCHGRMRWQRCAIERRADAIRARDLSQVRRQRRHQARRAGGTDGRDDAQREQHAARACSEGPSDTGKFLRGDATPAWSVLPSVYDVSQHTPSVGDKEYRGMGRRWKLQDVHRGSGSRARARFADRCPVLGQSKGAVIDRIAVACTTGQAGGACKLGLYKAVSVTDPFPGALIIAEQATSSDLTTTG